MKFRSRKPLTIAIVLPAYPLASNDVAQGIAKFGRARGRYDFRDLPFVDHREIPTHVARAKPDGMILWLAANDYQDIRDRLPSDLPIVNIGPPLPGKIGATVRMSDQAVVREAVEHLRASYAQLAFVGARNDEITTRRYKEFAKLVPGGHLFELEQIDRLADQDPGRETDLERWLASMQRPLGVAAIYGQLALRVAAACQHLHWRVPREIGLISLFDDRDCLMAKQALSAVRSNGEQLGFEAMRALAAILQGRSKGHPLILVPPREVIERGSAEPGEVDGDHVDRAVKFIAQHANQGINVQDVIRMTQTVSRRTFYNDFIARMDCTPADHICRVKMDRARQLLTKTQLPIKRVASMCGFHSSTRFGEMFRKIVGQTPLAYRQSGDKLGK